MAETEHNPGPTDGRVSVDAADLARFERLGEAWWDQDGPMGKLHEINPARMGYLRDMVSRHHGFHRASGVTAGLPFAGLDMLDIGCGGGLLSEPVARLGGRLTSIDPGEENIGVARRHAELSGLDIDYQAITAEAVAETGARFDVVLAMEVVEHVVDRDRFLATVCGLVRPGGLVIVSTLNRTAKSYMLAILGAEYLLRWVPRGTHQWTQFVTPEELSAPLRRAGLRVLDRTGLIYHPLRGDWRLSRDTDVNYFLTACKPLSPDVPAAR